MEKKKCGPAELCKNCQQLIRSVFPVVLGGENNTDHIAQSLRAGRFPVNERVTQENFPIHPRMNLITAEIQFIYPGKSFSEEEGLGMLEEAKLQRPTYEHLLRFTEKYGRTVPTCQKTPFLIFLHEPWLVTRHYPGELPHLKTRIIYMERFKRGWCELKLRYPGFRFGDYSFLAGVRESMQS